MNILEIRESILKEAKSLSSAFMAKRSGKFTDSEMWSDVSIRVRVIDSSLSIEWRKRWWIWQKNGKKIMRVTYIKKGKGYSYNKNTLYTNCKDWEKQEVSDVEDRFALLREAWDLSKQIEKDFDKLKLIVNPFMLKQLNVLDTIKLIEGDDFEEVAPKGEHK